MIDPNNIIVQNNNLSNTINIVNLNDFEDIPVYDLKNNTDSIIYYQYY